MGLELVNVRKSYPRRGGGVHEVLRGVNARIRRGEAVGILGRNGAGKSTLLRIVAGVERPSSGVVRRAMSISWPLGFGGAFQGALTGADNVRFIARIYGRPVQRTLEVVESFAELGEYLRMPFASYSSGMRARLAFAVSLAVDFDCYLVDEAIAPADARFAEKFRAAFAERARRSALILVTHSAATVRAYCTRAAILDGGTLTFYEDLDEALATYNLL
ncbi:ABC transporter ATP-binding protein [Caldovatus aquaticus]|uniref:ATP-binding cassette domain-containing protein n=1 Tax=Caldovatus aquaticus TaxID=2865671 RepID=A0ABS7F3A2_9PROT|nr:ATP-binding cassette domain-containing protein [Caldovatus aquaticus]MBW8270087.1 ATP-binding cassette domain-containing protein [Caldovatus aquaticus]